MAAVAVSWALLALGLGVLPLPLGLQLGGTGLLVVLGLWLWRPQRSRWALVVLLPLLLAWGLGHQPGPGPTDPVALVRGDSNQRVAIERIGTLLADPQPNLDGRGCRVPVQWRQGRSELRFRACPTLQEGWRLQVSGQLRRPRAAPHPLLAGPAERLARQGIWTVLDVQRWSLLAKPATPVADLRRRMAQALLERGGPEAGGVLAALVLGSAVVPVPLEVRDAFRVSGLSHALAASGFHLTVLLGAVMALARSGPKPLRWGLALGAMVLFLLLAGPQPSVVRAVVMGAMAFLVQESGRRSRPLGVLLLCLLLMLLWQPSWLLDVGFQLSVAATAGLLLTARPLEEKLAGPTPSKARQWLAVAVAVPLAASLWTLPLQLLHFGSVPLYAVAANLAVDPLLTPLTLGAMAMALVAVTVPALLGVIAWPLLPLTELLIWISRQFAALPLAQWQLGRLDPLLVVLFSAGLLPWLLAGPTRLRRWRGAGLALLAAAMALHLARSAGDHLLLVHEGQRDLLVARHGGRGALVSRSADRFSCGRARQLATGLGLQRYDWVLVSDPVASLVPECWQEIGNTVISAMGEADSDLAAAPNAKAANAMAANTKGPKASSANPRADQSSATSSPSLQVGQQLQSPGLSLRPLAADSQAAVLQAGRLRWLLLPDRQSWRSWQGQPQRTGEPITGLWLGFGLRQSERPLLPKLRPDHLWITASSTPGWRAL
jgi:competence protein ComEC